MFAPISRSFGVVRPRTRCRSLNGAVKSTYVGANIATDMLEDAKTEIAYGLKGSHDFRSTLLDLYTKVLARHPMKQLREN